MQQAQHIHILKKQKLFIHLCSNGVRPFGSGLLIAMQGYRIRVGTLTLLGWGNQIGSPSSILTKFEEIWTLRVSVIFSFGPNIIQHVIYELLRAKKD